MSSPRALDRRSERRATAADRRTFDRIGTDLLVNRFVNGHPYMCRMTDISRTGARLALHALDRGHTTTLLTSHPEVVGPLRGDAPLPAERWAVVPYQTFDELRARMGEVLQGGGVDALLVTPVVLLSQGWTYHVFRHRLGGTEPDAGAALHAQPEA